MIGDSSSNGALLSLRGVRVQRGGQTILDVPALDVPRHGVLAILGPNGSGKSTLVQVMALLLAADEGEVRFDGAAAVARSNPVALRRRMAVVFQEPLLFDTSVYGNVASGLRMRGVPRAEERDRVSLWLARLGIEHLAARQARTLSGGEARRASLARALVVDPELLLLDEPFSALDYYARQALLGELPALLAAARTTTVLVTHEPSEARQLADRAVALQGGRIVADGVPDEVLAAVALAARLPAPMTLPRGDSAIAVVRRLVEPSPPR